MADKSQRRASHQSASSKPPRRPSQSSTASAIAPSPLEPRQPPFLQTNQVPPPSSLQIPQSPALGHGQNAAKVAIPRLHRDAEGSTTGASKGGRHRVGHACEPCRTRKTKCSGERPVCKHCQDFKLSCYYADGKRDRVKKEFGTMTEKVQEYESLLRDLSARVAADDADLIQNTLEKAVAIDLESPSGTGSNSQLWDGAEESEGESEVSATVGSTGAVDRIEEDFNRNEAARATGFIGKNSEITWVQRLKQEVRIGSPPREADKGDTDFEDKAHGASPMFEPHKSGSTPLQDQDEEFSASATSYHLDDINVLIPDTVDPYEMPPREIADNLFSTYLNTVHPSFPIIGKATFISQYRKFFSSAQIKPGSKWLSILNLIFAISSKHSHLVQAEWRGDDRDHLLYFTRARMLAMNGDSLFNHADLQQIQICGLLAFYFLCTDQINRAWTFAGIAVRAAVGLGINMRNESTTTPDTSKEIRYRVWWSLYTVEHLLSVMTGRATSILDNICTTPLPVPLEEESFQTDDAVQMLGIEMQKGSRYPSIVSRSPSTSTPSSNQSRSASKPSASPAAPQPRFEWAKNVTPNQSLFFLHYVQLMRITQDILSKLYTPQSAETTWSNIQDTIAKLDAEIETWRSELPSPFEFTNNNRDQTFRRHRMSLGLAYYGTRITINRPTLCRLDRKIPNQSSKSKTFNRNAAAKCVELASEMVRMLPDEPNAPALYKASPWWCVLHYLMQAASVLMLELSFRADHMPEEAENTLESAKKVVRWLHHMAEDNVAARRAWGMCDALIREVAPKIGRNADELPRLPPGADPSSFGPIEMSDRPMVPPESVPKTMDPSQPEQPGILPILQGSLIDPRIYAAFDEFLPWNTTTGELTNSMFPTSGEMDFDGYNEEDEPPRN